MKTYIILFLLVSGALSSQAQEPLLYSTKPLSGSVAQVNAETFGGSITIEGGHDTDARLEVYVQRNNGGGRNLTKEEAQQLLEENYNLNIEEKGHTLQVSARHKRFARKRHNVLSISYKIFVPTKISTQIQTGGGSIRITNVSGTQNFSTAGGSLKLDQVDGKVNGKTAGGSISLSKAKGDIDLVTAGGNVMADHCDGTIHVETAGGTIKAKDMKGEFQTNTAGGNIQLEEMACSLDAGTSGGNIDVAISSLGKYVKLNTSGGNISLHLPEGKGMDLQLSGSHVSTGNLKSFQGDIKKDKITGALNGGGIPVEVSATGNVNAVFQ